MYSLWCCQCIMVVSFSIGLQCLFFSSHQSECKWCWFICIALQCGSVLPVGPVVHYIVVTALTSFTTELQCLGPPPSSTQLFSLGANRTCLQPTQLSCPPHTWKQSAFLLSAALLPQPLPGISSSLAAPSSTLSSHLHHSTDVALAPKGHPNTSKRE